MQTSICKNYEALSEQTASEIASLLIAHPSAVICLASGDTPLLATSLLADKIIHEGIDVSNVHFIGLDEWVGVPPANEGSCHYFFKNLLFDRLSLNPRQIHLFNGLSDELQAECSKMDDVINRLGGIDFMLVGIGMNGHIGFNEPGISFDRYCHVVELDAVTTNVGQKYFKEKTQLTKGITIGLKHLLESKKVMLIANGERKAAIIQLTLEGEIGEHVPASVMRLHSNSILLLDEAAASLLSHNTVINK